MEFWGDEVESLRSFSVYSQRSLGPLESVRLHAAAEEAGASPVNLLSLLPDGTRVVRLDPARARAPGGGFQADLRRRARAATGGDEYRGGLPSSERLAGSLSSLLDSLGMARAGGAGGDVPRHQRRAARDQSAGSRRGDPPAGERRVPGGDSLRAASGGGAGGATCFARTSGTAGHGGDVEAGPGVSFLPVALRRHFVIPELKLAVLTDTQVFPAGTKRPLPGGPPLGWRCPASAICARATTWSTRTTASAASRAYPPRPWPVSRVTTSTWPIGTPTCSTCPTTR